MTGPDEKDRTRPAVTEQEQAEITQFLSTPGELGPGAPEVRTTHISRLFLTPDRVFKQKRALRLPFLDFADFQARRDACAREVELNRRTAPDLYLGVRTVTREPRGALALDGTGPAVDWLVEMMRFDETGLADRAVRDGRFGAAKVRALADLIIAFHDKIDQRPDKGGAEAMKRTIRDLAATLGNADQRELAFYAEELAPPLLRASTVHHDLLDDRRAHGFVRQCHGDMHLGNICLINDQPTPFDCIEFNDDIACVDVLYDLAFPVMDLVHADHRAAASLLLSRYLAATEDYGGLALMPLFLGSRALVRTMAEGLAGRDEAARAYAQTADRLRRPMRPRVVAVGGLSGSGKSSVAAALAPALGPGPGAVVLRSDEIRKRLFGRKPEDRLGPEAYDPEVSRRVFDRMKAHATTALWSGWPVVLDATFMSSALRHEMEQLAADARVRFHGLWLDAPADVLRARVAGRTGDASDADVAILDRQLQADIGRMDWPRIDASGGIREVTANARAAL